ncbi:MAG TPA: hypothetical protein VN426_01770 [Syntrophomonadaceae bacterium]|nr:hypothetical protein [Syntrophomonadaceae bacterium]
MEREHQQIIDDIENSKFYECLELKITHLRTGWCEMHLPIKDLLLDRFGAVDSKVLYVLCDIAAFAVTCTLVPMEELPVHYSMHFTVISPVSQGGLKITAHGIEADVGGFIESKIWGEHDQLLAVGNIRF